MAQIQFFQRTTAPTTWVANSLYWIEDASGTSATAYITDAAGVPHDVGNATYITSVVTPLINSAIASVYNEVQIAADIAARDALSLTQNTMVIVTDASADSTVNSGSALYIWDNGASTWTKLSEFESLDINVAWADIQGGPTATPAQIDAAVGSSHTHANIGALNNISDDGSGNILYNGNPVSGTTDWTTTEW